MNLSSKRKFQSWANTMSLEEVLRESELCKPGIDCLYCGVEENVYCIEWDGDSDFYCQSCLQNFLEVDLPESSVNEGLLRKRFKVFSRDDFRCVYCGRSPKEHHITLEVDHIHPRSKKGSDNLENLATACYDCNRGKGDYLLSERAKLSFIRSQV